MPAVLFIKEQIIVKSLGEDMSRNEFKRKQAMLEKQMEQYLYTLLTSNRVSSKLDEEISLSFMKSSGLGDSSRSGYAVLPTAPDSDAPLDHARCSRELSTGIENFRSTFLLGRRSSDTLEEGVRTRLLSECVA